MSSVKVINNAKRFGSVSTNLLDSALERMARDVVNIAKIRVPFLSGTLMKAIEARKMGFLKHRVEVNTEYAAYQERGQRHDGTRVVKYYTTPRTGKGFLKEGGDSITKNAINYLKQAAQLAKV